MGAGPLNLDAVALVGGSSPASSKRWSKTWAKRLADVFHRNEWSLVYCGMGTGLAGDVAKALLAKGGVVLAIVVEGREPPDVPTGAKRVVVPDFHERTRKLFELGDAALIVPGGLGTLAEMAELAAWRSSGLYVGNLAVFDPDDWFSHLYKFLNSVEKAGLMKGKVDSVAPRVKTIAELRKVLTDPGD